MRSFVPRTITTTTALLLLLALAALLILSPSVEAQTAAQTCAAGDTTSDPLYGADFTDPKLFKCVQTRCENTIGVKPTLATNGYCNGDATLEADVPCQELLGAYTVYYACALSALIEADAATQTALANLIATPGYPARLTLAGCYSCNNFRQVMTDMARTSTCDWSCLSCCGQGLAGKPFRNKDYAYVLCGKACEASILIACMVTMAIFMFAFCGAFWPGPSLKTTAAKIAAEERENEAVHSSKANEEERRSSNSSNNNNNKGSKASNSPFENDENEARRNEE